MSAFLQRKLGIVFKDVLKRSGQRSKELVVLVGWPQLFHYVSGQKVRHGRILSIPEIERLGFRMMTARLAFNIGESK